MRKLLVTIAAAVSFGSAAQAETVSLLDAGGVNEVGSVFVGRAPDNIRIRVDVDDGVLTPGNVYQLLVRIYNNPQFCATPNQCAGSDLPANGGNAMVEATQFVLTGGIAQGGGERFFGRIYASPEGVPAISDLVQGGGLLKPTSAHVDVMVRDMDTAQAGENLFSQFKSLTADGQCDNTITCTVAAISDVAVP